MIRVDLWSQRVPTKVIVIAFTTDMGGKSSVGTSSLRRVSDIAFVIFSRHHRQIRLNTTRTQSRGP